MFATPLRVICIAVTAIVTPSAALAGPAAIMRDFSSKIERLREGNFTLAPFAAVKFCAANQELCRISVGEDVVELTPDRKQELQAVNSGINRAIKPKSDEAKTDTWSVDVEAGDCEDYALTKRKHLIALGWSPRALRIAVAKTSSGEGHAVLVVKTSAADLVLDNRTAAIREWNKTDLNWIMIQSGENPRLWLSVERTSSRPLLVSEQLSNR